MTDHEQYMSLALNLAREAYDRFGVVAFERSAKSIYSKRMVEAFDSRGMVRLSPLHVNTPEDIRTFLKATKDLAGL